MEGYGKAEVTVTAPTLTTPENIKREVDISKILNQEIDKIAQFAARYPDDPAFTSLSQAEKTHLHKAVTAYVRHFLDIQKFRARRKKIFDALRKRDMPHDQKVATLTHQVQQLHERFPKLGEKLPAELWAIIDAELEKLPNREAPLSTARLESLPYALGEHILPYSSQAILSLFGWEEKYRTGEGTNLSRAQPNANGSLFCAISDDKRMHVYRRQEDGKNYAHIYTTPPGTRFKDVAQPNTDGSLFFGLSRDNDQVHVYAQQEGEQGYAPLSTPQDREFDSVEPNANGSLFFGLSHNRIHVYARQEDGKGYIPLYTTPQDIDSKSGKSTQDSTFFQCKPNTDGSLFFAISFDMRVHVYEQQEGGRGYALYYTTPPGTRLSAVTPNADGSLFFAISRDNRLAHIHVYARQQDKKKLCTTLYDTCRDATP